jgi:4-hydroxybenzoate polyprenyltransferase
MRLSLQDVTKAVRTRQWAKNALLFAGFLFAGRLRAPEGAQVLQSEVLRVFLGFVCFCALSAVAYLINDWKDIERDKLHPIKCHRPLASGRLSKNMALALMVVCSPSSCSPPPQSWPWSRARYGSLWRERSTSR